jgi:hypothetical protein
MRAWRASFAKDPAIAKLYELIVKRANEKGGVALAVWRLHMGQIFGEPIMMTPDEVAKRLKLPVSDVTRIVRDIDADARAEWRRSDEYRKSRYAEQGG